jgi:lysophospholipase L1-like esterase
MPLSIILPRFVSRGTLRACAGALIISTLLAGCARAATPAPLTPTASACASHGEAAMQFLALGDSYTIGESVDPAERWPVQLTALLREQGFNVAEPTLTAQTGWTTDELAAAIAMANPQGPYDLVSLLIGVNNQYRGRDTEEYRHQFVSLLEQAIAFAGGHASRVIVLSIPDWGVTPFAAGRDRAAIGRAIDSFNAINRAETERLGAAYVDVTPGSREAATDPGLVAADGLHPSGRMYAEWARLSFPAAFRALQQP